MRHQLFGADSCVALRQSVVFFLQSYFDHSIIAAALDAAAAVIAAAAAAAVASLYPRLHWGANSQLPTPLGS